MIFCALHQIPGGIGGRAGFISQIFSCWYAILLEGYMFHDLSEVDLGLATSDVTAWKDSSVIPLAIESLSVAYMT